MLLRLEKDEFGLSSGEESDFEGEEVHGYLPSPSEVPVSEIGGADSPSTALMRAMMMLLHAGLAAAAR